MLQWSFVFLVIGLIAAVLNSGVNSAPWSDIIAIVFFTSLLLFCSTLIGDYLQRRPHPRSPSGSKEKDDATNRKRHEAVSHRR